MSAKRLLWIAVAVGALLMTVGALRWKYQVRDLKSAAVAESDDDGFNSLPEPIRSAVKKAITDEATKAVVDVLGSLGSDFWLSAGLGADVLKATAMYVNPEYTDPDIETGRKFDPDVVRSIRDRLRSFSTLIGRESAESPVLLMLTTKYCLASEPIRNSQDYIDPREFFSDRDAKQTRQAPLKCIAGFWFLQTWKCDCDEQDGSAQVVFQFMAVKDGVWSTSWLSLQLQLDPNSQRWKLVPTVTRESDRTEQKGAGSIPQG